MKTWKLASRVERAVPAEVVMVCYGGACEKTCPMYEIHNPSFVECESCGKTVLSWYLKEGLCPECQNGDAKGTAEGQGPRS